MDDYPETWQEFIANFTDIGTTWNGKGCVFVPIDRVHQMVEHYFERTCQIEEVCCCSKGNGRICNAECIDGDPCWSENICTACGEYIEGKPNYCPSCGAKVVR